MKMRDRWPDFISYFSAYQVETAFFSVIFHFYYYFSYLRDSIVFFCSSFSAVIPTKQLYYLEKKLV